MRVIIATGIFPPDVGGPATHTFQLAGELRNRGHQVVVVSLTDGPRTVSEDGVVRYPRRWPWPVRTGASAGWLVRHRREYDIVYASGLDLAAVAGARLARRPVVLKVVGDPAWERGRRLGLTAAAFGAFQREPVRSLRLRGMRAARNWSVRHATEIVTPSDYLRVVVEGWTGGRRPISVVPNGAVVTRRGASTPSGEGGGTGLRLAYLGRLVDHKRVDVLVDAVASTEGVTLAIVGDGPERGRLEAQVLDSGSASRVRFLGPLSHGGAMDQLAAAHVLVNSSTYEGLPHVAIESLVLGVPVVCSPAGGTVEAVQDERNGLLVDPPTAAAFATAFARLRDDATLLDRLTRGARRSGESWHFGRCADQVEQLLLAATTGRPRAVYLGQGLSFPPNDELRRKLALHARFLRQTNITTGKAGVRRVSGVRVVSLPQVRPPILGGLLFYATAPFLALGSAVGRHRAAIVCQSPFEALGVILLSRLVPEALRPRVQVELHGDWRTAPRLYGSRGRALLGPLSDRAAEWSLRRADRVRVVSKLLADQARQAGYRGPIDRHFTFSHFGAFLERPPTSLPDQPRALFIGVLERYKAIDVLLEAWHDVVAVIPEAELLIVGEGTLGPKLRQRLSTRDIPSVRLKSPVSQPELARLLDGCTCMVLPSRSEGLPRVVMEAMARGRPVVVSDVGGMRELVVEGVTGRLVPAGDARKLANVLAETLGDRDGAARLGALARRHAEERDPVAEYEAGIRRLAAWIDGE